MYEKTIEKAKSYWTEKDYSPENIPIYIKKSQLSSKEVVAYMKNNQVFVYLDRVNQEKLDLAVVIAHELGHALGIRHYDPRYPLMRGKVNELAGMKL